jgi:CRISPR/Cas system-associated protein Cas5 (RAMP superfamily)
MVLKPEDTVAETEIKPVQSAVERTEDLAEEFGGENRRERPQEGEVEHDEADESTERASKNDFTVESPGMLYAHWSGTVLIRRETLFSWGKVKEVDVETNGGKIMTCKVYPVEDLETGVIQVPDRMQLKLGVKKGSIVKAKPAANP